MFWASVWSGLEALFYWQTYAAGLVFFAMTMGPLLLFGMVMERTGRAGFMVGCLSMLVMPFFQVFALVVFVMTMAPLILGISNDVKWSLPWLLVYYEPIAIIFFVGKLLLVALVLAFIPLVGRSMTLHTLVLGVLALASWIGLLGKLDVTYASQSVELWPGWWFGLGLLMFGGVLAWFGMLLSALVATALDQWSEGLGVLVAMPVSAIFGFLPLFIYAAWLGEQLRR